MMQNKWRAALCAAVTMGMGLSVQAAGVATGAAAPEFALQDQDGKEHKLSDFKGKFVVLEWINHGCPFVVKHYASGNMQKLQKDYAAKDVVWLSVCSSAPGKQGHLSAAEWQKKLKETGAAPAAVLLDESGEVGKAYQARTTPHMYVVNPEGVLIYQGAIDSKSTADQADIASSVNYVAAALDAALEGKDVAEGTTKPYGCSVKYAN